MCYFDGQLNVLFNGHWEDGIAAIVDVLSDQIDPEWEDKDGLVKKKGRRMISYRPGVFTKKSGDWWNSLSKVEDSSRKS